MKLYGIWMISQAKWIIDGNGVIFYTPHKVIADAQANQWQSDRRHIEVREFPEEVNP